MLCPMCLAEVHFTLERVEGRPAPLYRCPACKEQIPASYVLKYKEYPPVVISAVGFRQHGKTVYLASLFYALKKLGLSEHWPSFFTMGLDEADLETIYKNVDMLDSGELPDSTPKNFPRPTMIHVHGVPFQPNCTLLCYDTGGECFERPTQLVQYAGFVSRAHTVLFLISIPNLADPSRDMQKLLNVYISGLAELGADSKSQHLSVIYAKADEAVNHLMKWKDLGSYLTQGSVDGLSHPKGYVKRMHSISDGLRAFTAHELRAHEFLNAADKYFTSTTFSIVSALGAQPIPDPNLDKRSRLSVQITPRRVLDPLLWAMEKSLPRWKQRWRRWWK